MSIKVRSLEFTPSIDVEIEDAAGNKSLIKFKRKLARDQRLEIADLQKRQANMSGTELADSWMQYLSDQIVSVEGLKQDGQPITLEMIKNGEVYNPVLVLLNKCYVIGVQNDGEDLEKKDLESVA